MDRQEILRRFEVLLDSAMSSEDPPGGIDAQVLASVLETGDSASLGASNPACDSYTLWAAMTSLTQEIKLQGRAFQELNRTIAGQTDKVADELGGLRADRERTVERECERRCRKEALNAFIDLRDRLVRGRETVAGCKRKPAGDVHVGWWARIFRKDSTEPAIESVAALTRGYELGIERLDQVLDEFNAREIRCQGEPFDPRRMNAIDSEETSSVSAGTVLEVYRSGFEWNGELFRPAQVKVSRAAAVSEQEHE